MTRRKQKQLGDDMRIYRLLRGQTWKGKWAKKLQECEYMTLLIATDLLNSVYTSSRDTKPPAENICEKIYNEIEDALSLGKISLSDTPEKRIQFFIDNYGYYCPAVCSWLVRIKPIFASNPDKAKPFQIAH